MPDHTYAVTITWIGNLGSGTSDYRAYSRNHEVVASGKPTIAASSDPAFRGDADRWNPEELFLASLSQCHMLMYLGLCAKHGISVLAYDDSAKGTMVEEADGAGRFTSVTLHPTISLADVNDRERADALHHEAHRMCFIANSVSCDVRAEATYNTTS